MISNDKAFKDIASFYCHFWTIETVSGIVSFLMRAKL
jgi:hypothetical protein